MFESKCAFKSTLEFGFELTSESELTIGVWGSANVEAVVDVKVDDSSAAIDEGNVHNTEGFADDSISLGVK